MIAQKNKSRTSATRGPRGSGAGIASGMIRYNRTGHIAAEVLPGLIDAYIPRGFEYFLRWEDIDKAYTCVQRVEFEDRSARDTRKLVLYVEATRKRGVIRCEAISTTIEQFQKTLAVSEDHMTTVTVRPDAPKRIVLYMIATSEADVQKILAASKAVHEYVPRMQAVLSGILDTDAAARTAVSRNLVSEESVFYSEALVSAVELVHA